MNRTRTFLIAGSLILTVSVVALAFPLIVPLPLLTAVAFAVHRGPRATAMRWIAGWLLTLEALSGSPFGTLALPFAAILIILAVAQRRLALDPWSQRPGWQLTDALRAGLSAAGFGIISWVCWVIVGGILAGGRIMPVLNGYPDALLPVALISVLALLVVRTSTQPFRRAIVFEGS